MKVHVTAVAGASGSHSSSRRLLPKPDVLFSNATAFTPSGRTSVNVAGSEEPACSALSPRFVAVRTICAAGRATAAASGRRSHSQLHHGEAAASPAATSSTRDRQGAEDRKQSTTRAEPGRDPHRGLRWRAGVRVLGVLRRARPSAGLPSQPARLERERRYLMRHCSSAFESFSRAASAASVCRSSSRRAPSPGPAGSRWGGGGGAGGAGGRGGRVAAGPAGFRAFTGERRRGALRGQARRAGGCIRVRHRRRSCRRCRWARAGRR